MPESFLPNQTPNPKNDSSPQPVLPKDTSSGFTPPSYGLETMKQFQQPVVAPEAPVQPRIIRESSAPIVHSDIPQPITNKPAKNYKTIYIIIAVLGLIILLGTGFYLFVWPKMQGQGTAPQNEPGIEAPPPPPAAPEALLAPSPTPENTSAPTEPTPATTTQEPTSAPKTEEPPIPPPPPEAALVPAPSPIPTIETPEPLSEKIILIFNKSRDAWGWISNNKIYLRWNPKTYSYFNVGERLGGAATWNTIIKSGPLPEYERSIPLATKRIDFKIQGVDANGKTLETYLIIIFELQ